MRLAATRSSTSCAAGGPAEALWAPARGPRCSAATSAAAAPPSTCRRVTRIIGALWAALRRRDGLGAAGRGHGEGRVALARLDGGGPAGRRGRAGPEHGAARRAGHGGLGGQDFQRLGQRAAAARAIAVDRGRDRLRVAAGLGGAGHRQVLAHHLLLALAREQQQRQRRHAHRSSKVHHTSSPRQKTRRAGRIVTESYAARPYSANQPFNDKERAMSVKRHGVGPRLSQAVVHGNTVYLAGLVAGDPSADARGQTEQILKKIDDLLAATGSHKSKLLSATIYVASMALYNDMNAAWDAWVDPANAPARATVEARLASPKYVVEIMVVAAI